MKTGPGTNGTLPLWTKWYVASLDQLPKSACPLGAVNTFGGGGRPEISPRFDNGPYPDQKLPPVLTARLVDSSQAIPT